MNISHGKKIVTHEIAKFSLQHFLSASSLGVAQGGLGRPLRWVDGVILEISAFRDTDDIIKEKLAGTVHYSAVSHSSTRIFSPSLK